MSDKVEKYRIPPVKLFLCGDVMTGRGIDQGLPHPVHPVLYETWVKNAKEYLHIAEQKNGKIETPVSWDYIWGDALKAWEENQPDLKLINLETSITTFPEPWPGKGINYRMNPKNIQVLKIAGIDHCSLANNHTLDWGRPGLKETLQTLRTAKIRYSGAGLNSAGGGCTCCISSEKAGVCLCFHMRLQVVEFPNLAGKIRPAGCKLFTGLGETEMSQIKQTIGKVKRKAMW
jgi:poly-gamma-glutamate capsule biosynthesis protein CapA/YwtB (metallophosphatase superfamily)